MQSEPYGTSRGVEAAIKEAAKKAASQDPSLDTNKRIQLEYFNRFLSRVFSEGSESEWVLKGGAGMLARIPSTRSTRDIDLYRKGFTIEQALADLKRLAAIDLGDHFRFEYASYQPTLGADTQPYAEGYRVSFTIFIGVTSKGPLNIDLAVGAGVTDEVTIINPATALELPRLASNPYRLYPVVDQIADKVCATMELHNGEASTRQKDLVDLVILAVTHDVDGSALSMAISTESARRRMEPISAFVVPAKWGSGYAKLSKPVPHCANYRTLSEAVELVSRFLNPVLEKQTKGRKWSHETLEWE